MIHTRSTTATIPLEPISVFARSRRTFLQILQQLDEQSYDFLAPTPASHARILARRPDAPGTSIVDLLGWSMACHAEAIGPLTPLLEEAGVLDWLPGGTIQSRIRVSRVM